MPLLELKNVNKEFEDGDIKVKALKNINLKLNKGEFVAFIGPSGCGKTTLLNVINRLYQPSGGEIIFNDKKLSDYNEQEWCYCLQNNIGFIYQHYELIESLNIEDNIKFKLNNNEEFILQMLDKLNLKEHKLQRCSLLSGGQKQRVGVLRALTNEPLLILADEPTGALDIENSELILKLLLEYSNNTLVLMVTHNEELVRKYVSKIIYMEHGEIKEIETLRENKTTNLKRKKEKIYKKFSFMLGIKYLISSIKSLKIRFIFLISSGSFIFLFISLLFSAIKIANNYVDNQYMYTPLYNVFDLYTNYEENGSIINGAINQDILAKLIKGAGKDYLIRENINNILNNYFFSKIYFNNKEYDNFIIRSLGNKLDDNSFIIGKNIQDINEVLISESLAAYLNEDIYNIIGKEISALEIYTYQSNEVKKNKKFTIVGVIKDSLFSQSKEIYVDYDLYLNKLRSMCINDNILLFDIFFDYNYQLVIPDLSKVKDVIDKIKNNPFYKENNIVMNHSYHFTISDNISYEEKEMFSELINTISLLVYFFILLGLIIFTIFITYVLSSFVLEKKKDYAIFLQLGIQKNSLYKLILFQSLFISFAMIIIGLILLFATYIIYPLFNIPLKIDIPYISIGVLISIFVILCIISSLLPIVNLKKIEPGSILKSE